MKTDDKNPKSVRKAGVHYENDVPVTVLDTARCPVCRVPLVATMGFRGPEFCCHCKPRQYKPKQVYGPEWPRDPGYRPANLTRRSKPDED